MKNQNSIYVYFFILLINSCCFKNIAKNETNNINNGNLITYCTDEDKANNKKSIYEFGDIICSRFTVKSKSNEILKIKYKTLNKSSEDLYKKGYSELLRYKNGVLIESMKLRKDNDPAWMFISFVRIRRMKYFSDLDNDGYDEFAIFPFSSGSAVYGTVRIFSLKNKIKFWGIGKIHIEGDGHVLLNCPKCSKFNLEECKKCE